MSAAALRANILDSQRHNQPYREFTRRAMAGGVQGCIAFLRGKRMTYWGRTGDQHTEWFPGSVPDLPPSATRSWRTAMISGRTNCRWNGKLPGRR